MTFDLDNLTDKSFSPDFNVTKSDTAQKKDDLDEKLKAYITKFLDLKTEKNEENKESTAEEKEKIFKSALKEEIVGKLSNFLESLELIYMTYLKQEICLKLKNLEFNEQENALELTTELSFKDLKALGEKAQINFKKFLHSKKELSNFFEKIKLPYYNSLKESKKKYITENIDQDIVIETGVLNQIIALGQLESQAYTYRLFSLIENKKSTRKENLSSYFTYWEEKQNTGMFSDGKQLIDLFKHKVFKEDPLFEKIDFSVKWIDNKAINKTISNDTNCTVKAQLKKDKTEIKEEKEEIKKDEISFFQSMAVKEQVIDQLCNICTQKKISLPTEKGDDASSKKSMTQFSVPSSLYEAFSEVESKDEESQKFKKIGDKKGFADAIIATLNYSLNNQSTSDVSTEGGSKKMKALEKTKESLEAYCNEENSGILQEIRATDNQAAIKQAKRNWDDVVKNKRSSQSWLSSLRYSIEGKTFSAEQRVHDTKINKDFILTVQDNANTREQDKQPDVAVSFNLKEKSTEKKTQTSEEDIILAGYELWKNFNEKKTEMEIQAESFKDYENAVEKLIFSKESTCNIQLKLPNPGMLSLVLTKLKEGLLETDDFTKGIELYNERLKGTATDDKEGNCMQLVDAGDGNWSYRYQPYLMGNRSFVFH